MNLRKTFRLFFLLAAFALSVSAQQTTVEYGQPDELRGVSKIFVATGADIERRNSIAKAIRKRLPDIEIVSRPEEADVHIRFYATKTSDGENQQTGTIVKKIGDDRERILYNFKSLMFTFGKRDEASGVNLDEIAKPYLVAAEFVKIYRKANSEGAPQSQ